jgi:hypothetical protein
MFQIIHDVKCPKIRTIFPVNYSTQIPRRWRFKKKKSSAGGVAQMVEHLLNKRPEFNSSTAKRKKKNPDKHNVNTPFIILIPPCAP